MKPGVPSAVLICAPSIAAAAVFTPVTTGPVANNASGGSESANWVDYDGDGRIDLFVSRGGFPGTNRLYRNRGDGTFARITLSPLTDGNASNGATWADFDNDGDADCFLTVGGGDDRLYRNEGPPDFAFTLLAASAPASSGGNGFGTSWGDFDRDGLADLAVANFPGTNFLYRNEGGGTFAPLAADPVMTDPSDVHNSAVWADYDDDGDPDLFFAVNLFGGGTGNNRLYRNLHAETGTATFERITAGAVTEDADDSAGGAWIDFDNDRDLDLFVTNWLNAAPNALYRNDSGSFVRISAGAITADSANSSASAWGDYDNDGDLDCFVANDLTQSDRYYRNDGGTFASIAAGAAAADSASGWGAGNADYDDDGDLDLFVANQGSPSNFLYRNDTGGGNHWLSVSLVGTMSNRSALGARVEVRAVIDGAPRWQMREISAQQSVVSQNDGNRAHFGLGDAATVDSLVVRWPSGSVTVAAGFEPNRFLTLIEGASATAAPAAPVWGTARLVAAPNPFREGAVLRFVAPGSVVGRLSVHDVAGRRVRTLNVAGSDGAVHWNGRDEAGAAVPPGVYFLRLVGRDGATRAVSRVVRGAR